MNSVVLTGRLTKDPVLKIGEIHQKAYCKAVIATKKPKGDSVAFVPIVAFNKRAEALAENVKKGDWISVSCYIDTSSEEINGELKYYTNIIVREMTFIGSTFKEQVEE